MWLHSPEGGDLLVGISPDNRIRLYDATTGALRQKYIEKDHFAFKYTCLAWTRRVGWNDKHTNKVISSKSGLGLLALGSDQGHISVWDLTRGVLALRLGEGQNLKRTTGIAFSADGRKIYSSVVGEGEVMEWELKSGECVRRIQGDKHGATALALDPTGGLLAVGRTRIHLIDVESGERRKKISSGHSSAVTKLVFSPCGGFVASASEGQRHVNIFECRSRKHHKSAVATVALDGCPTASLALQVEKEGEDKVVFTLMACCDTGSVRVVRQTWAAAGGGGEGDGEEPQQNGNSSTPAAAAAAPPAVLKVVRSTGSSKGKDKDNVGALAGCFLPGAEGVGETALTWRCALVYGSENNPAFETFTYANGGGKEKLLSKVTLALAGGGAGGGEGEEGGEVEAGSKRKRKEVRAVDAQDPAAKKVATDGSASAGMSGSGKTSMNNTTTLTSTSTNTEEEEEAHTHTHTQTIGERLLAMAEGIEAVGEAEAKAAATTSTTTKTDALLPPTHTHTRTTPKADSLVTVLSQALKSTDDDLLEHCLSIHDTHTISNTIQLLPPPLTFPLIDTLVHKLTKRPNRATMLCPWIRYLLLHHTSYLVSVPSLHQRLAGLHQLVTRRVAVLPRLLGLSGRLELMLSQISKHGGDGGGKGEEKVVSVYVDGESGSEGEEEEGEEGGLESESEEDGEEEEGEEMEESEEEEEEEDDE